MLSNTYFLSKFRFDTAENEPAKFSKNANFANFASLVVQREKKGAARSRSARPHVRAGRAVGAAEPAEADARHDAQVARRARGRRIGLAERSCLRY